MSPAVVMAGLGPLLLGIAVVQLPVGRGALLATLRSFAIAGALVVVAFDLLPSALAEVGVAAVLAFLAGLVVPGLLEAGLPRLGARVGGVWLHEIALIGLALHQALDGLQIGSMAASLGVAGTLAISAHGAPLVAAASVGERATGLWRGGVLLVATSIGLAVGAVVPAPWVAPIEPWAKAAVAGMLLHLLAHGPSTSEGGATERIADWTGFLAGGVAAAWLVGLRVPGGAEPVLVLVGHAGPAIAVGLVLGAVLQAIGMPKLPRGRFLAALHGTLAAHGAPAEPGSGRGAAGLARALGSPLLSIDSTLLVLALFGPHVAAVRWVAGCCIALVGGAVGAEEDGAIGGPPLDLRSAFLHRLAALAPNVALGLVLAAALPASVRWNELAPWQALLLSAPMSAPPTAWMLPVAAFDGAGAEGPAVWAAVFLGPWLGVVGLRRIWVDFGHKALGCAFAGAGLLAAAAFFPGLHGSPVAVAIPTGVGLVLVGAIVLFGAAQSSSDAWLQRWIGDPH